jgi:hypothetical protein
VMAMTMAGHRDRDVAIIIGSGMARHSKPSLTQFRNVHIHITTDGMRLALGTRCIYTG